MYVTYAIVNELLKRLSTFLPKQENHGNCTLLCVASYIFQTLGTDSIYAPIVSLSKILSNFLQKSSEHEISMFSFS